MAGPDALVCGGQRAGTGPGAGRLAQRESASFTPRRSLVRSQYRPPSSPAGCDLVTGRFDSPYNTEVQQRSLAVEPLAELPERGAGGGRGYLGVDLHRDGDLAVPQD